MILECNILIFDINKLAKIVKSYDTETNIQLKLLTEEKTEGSEGSEGFWKDEDIVEQKSNIGLTNKQNNSHNLFERNPDNNPNNITTKSEKLVGTTMESPYSSEPSGSYYVSNLPRFNAIYRLGHSDTFACTNCKVRGDKFLMERHACMLSK